MGWKTVEQRREYMNAYVKSRRQAELLCDSCNVKLGGLEQPEWKVRAEAYLEKHNG